MNKRVLGIIAVVIIVIAGFFWLTKPKADAPSNNTPPSNHIEGTGSKGVTLVEYGDFQCPACGSYYPILKTLVEKYKGDIFFQFRNYPLESIHQNARASARAAEAANIQGKFWEMHDALYENQSSWENSSDPLSFYKQYAKQIGVSDLTKFETDYKSAGVNDIINADLKEGQKYSITGTPTFVLDDKKIDNPSSVDAFNKLIDEAIAAKAN
jgi:protein-disulfide isomerase